MSLDVIGVQDNIVETNYLGGSVGGGSVLKQVQRNVGVIVMGGHVQRG